MKKLFYALLALSVSSFSAAAQQMEESDLKIPSEVAPFVEIGSKAIALETADLNGDGSRDFVLVLEKNETKRDKDGFPLDQRPLLILIRQSDESLKLAGRNEKVVFCSTCGGVFGDPFAGIKADKNTFTVNLYGGSNWRWTENYTFNYSRRDKTWQLVRIESGSFHVFEPTKIKRKVLTQKKIGKINFADFDPDKFL